MENTTAALTAAQALHAGTIQERLTVAQDRSEEETVIKNDEPHKRCIFKTNIWKKRKLQIMELSAIFIVLKIQLLLIFSDL